MRFYRLVKEIRTRKKNLHGNAFTQKSCGSRMTPPISQEGWSRYENRDTEPNYDTVKQIAIALDITDEQERRDFFKAAGYNVEEDLGIQPLTMKELDQLHKDNPGAAIYISQENPQGVVVPMDILKQILDTMNQLKQLHPSVEQKPPEEDK
jgi:transcriptional regulator with XRE-family HTH domain